ncbi:hypothetical protein OsJ_28771 [Oryza sativa Japonica Group]|uniref:DUF4216 domain-containing protein n=1 Tax=Oryza sativa subsp. japonica TaxID=39947 RepID=A3BX57_ORYSJ|nr:hypothetical protein OsJ_28771 [Oryza sativa Japonica Group]
MAYGTKIEVQQHLLGRGFDKDFIKQKRSVSKPMVVDDREISEAEVDDVGSVDNLLSSLISGAIHGDIRDNNIKVPNESAIFSVYGRSSERIIPRVQGGYKDLHRMRHYIISNCDEAMPWVNEHIEELKKTNRGNVDKRHKEQFVSWFERKMNILHADGKIDQDIYCLSRGPDHRVRVANRCSINGFLFRTTNVEKNLTTQNSGVVVQGEGMDWYGVIKKIITLNFPNDKEVLLFECDWFDVPGATTN